MKFRAVSVGDRRSVNRLLDAINLAALDVTDDGEVAHRIAVRALELLHGQGYVITRQVTDIESVPPPCEGVPPTSGEEAR